jgi:hypothetical protein
MPSALNIPKPAPTRGQWTNKYYGVTAGQTFKAGDHVYLDGSGTLAIAATSTNDVGNVKLLGIALASAADILAQTGDFAVCPVKVPVPGSGEFLTQLYHSTAASAVLTAGGLDTPSAFPLRNEGGRWVANVETDGTNDRVVITERSLRYPFSEEYGWFWCAYTSVADGIFLSAT